ncbi:DNA-directed DNA polymerase [Malassezia yamatoensis]|uniref:DNA-directed DNA polymerase n=1 Tax=Malassezia yamatoensis TaxID=253288 RepID=A0AAJ6CFM2_9BASI|nr:DNA-directed DNA polymerase [Malassezia yamatoensis]
MGSTLALFWKLADGDQAVRIDASNALVSTLLSQQQIEAEDVASPKLEFPSEPATVTDGEVASVEQRLDEFVDPEVAYALRRLVRGLASPRENARAGFAVALSELLSHLNTVTAYDVLVLLIKNTMIHGSMNGQEVRDAQFARLFGIYALIRSALLYKPSSSLAVFKRVFEVILSIASTKTWLSEPCGYVLMELIEPLADKSESCLEWAHFALQFAAQRVCASQHLSPPSLALIMTLAQIDPEIFNDAHVNMPLKSFEVLAPSNLPILARTLREAAPLFLEADATQPTGGTWATKVPLAWDLLLAKYFSGVESKNSAPFADFWRMVVDESLFANQASPERKSWGFQILHRSLERAPQDLLPFLFTPNLMRTWVNQLSGKDRLLHSMALKTVEYVSRAVKRSPTAGVALVTQLLGEHGRQDFDKVTHTKTIESILSSLDQAGIQRYLEHLRNVAYQVNKSDSVLHVTTQRQWAADQMLALVRSNLIPKSDEWLYDVITFLTAFGCFEVVKTPTSRKSVLTAPSVAFHEQTQALYRLRLQACLTELKGSEINGRSWPMEAASIVAKMKKDKCFKSVASGLAQERVESAYALLHSLQKKERKASAKTKAFETLVAAVILITYEDTEESSNLVEPLVDVADVLFLGKKADKDQGIGAMELLVDVFIGLLEISSSFLRAIVSQAFAIFSGDLNAESLDHLIDQLGLNEPAAEEDEEQAEDPDNEDEEMEEDEQDSEEEDNEDDHEESSDDEGGDTEVDPVLLSKVEAAFREKGLAEDSADESDDDLDTFDDDQMSQLDDKLAEIFVQHSKSNRKEREILQRDTAVFHNKILDLLEIYAKEQNAKVHVARLAAPLFALAKGAGDVSEQVATRAGQLLRGRVCRSKERLQGNLEQDFIEDELRAIHNYLRSCQDVRLAELAGLVSQFYTKVLLRNGKDGMVPVKSVHEETLQDFLQRKASPVRAAFFLDSLRRYPELGWELREALLEGGRNGARAFRQIQALSMLQTVLQHQQREDSRQATLVEMFDFLKKVRQMVYELVHAAATSDALNAQRLKDVLRFALQAVRVTLRVTEDTKSGAEKMAEVWPPAQWQDLMSTMQSSERFQNSTSLHGIIKEILAVITRAQSSPKQNKKRTAPSASSAKPAKKPAKKLKKTIAT